MPKFKKIKAFDPMPVPNTIIKIKPSFFGTQDDIHHPDCKVMVKTDIWIVRESLPKADRFYRKVVGTDYIQSVVVDFENHKLLKDGDEITAHNVEAVFEVLENMLRS